MPTAKAGVFFLSNTDGYLGIMQRQSRRWQLNEATCQSQNKEAR